MLQGATVTSVVCLVLNWNVAKDICDECSVFGGKKECCKGHL
jgi:hypothetical protein